MKLWGLEQIKKVLETEVPGGWRRSRPQRQINHLSPLSPQCVHSQNWEGSDNSSVPPARTPYWEQPLEAPQAVILGLLAQTYPSSATSPTLFSPPPRPAKAVSAPPSGSHNEQALCTGILNTLHHGYSCSHLTPASDSALPRAETCWVPLGTTPSSLHLQSTCLAGTQQVLHKCLLDG